jgi:hypothetical protein
MEGPAALNPLFSFKCLILHAHYCRVNGHHSQEEEGRGGGQRRRRTVAVTDLYDSRYLTSFARSVDYPSLYIYICGGDMPILLSPRDSKA